jgi:ATP diphosphatase
MTHGIDRLTEIMAKLRDPAGGCPWDLEQTFRTIAPYTIEESYEVADAIERDDMAELKEELGDLLLQVVFHAQMAAERRAFAFADVVEAICAKLVRRHPHVFGQEQVETAAAQTALWERHKARERLESRADGGGSEIGALDGVPRALPALLRAAKLQKRAALVGFDWPDAGAALAKFTEESRELADEMAAGAGADRLGDELGDLLFTAVNVARKLELDPEQALRRANDKFERRFRQIEAMLREDGGRRPADADLAELDALWERAKAKE